jgi:Mrp family chromosome partitioning ATPase
MGILKKSGRANRPTVGRDGNFLSAAEAYRHLAVQLHFDVMGSGNGCCLMLTCPDSRDQAEQATRMLAAFLAEEQEHSVLIIDAGFAGNTLGAQFQAPRSPGLLNILDGSEPDFLNAVRPTGHPNIFFLPVGESQLGPRKLLMSPLFAHTLDQFRSRYDFSLVSTASVLEDSSALAIPSLVDCVLLLILGGVTRWPTVNACRTAMENCKARRIEPVLGSR